MSVFQENFEPYEAEPIDWAARGWSGAASTAGMRQRGGIGDSAVYACCAGAPYLTLSNETEGTMRGHVAGWRESWAGNDFEWHFWTVEDTGGSGVTGFQIDVHILADTNDPDTGRVKVAYTTGSTVVEQESANGTFPIDGQFRALQVTWEISGTDLLIQVTVNDVLVLDITQNSVSYTHNYATRFTLSEAFNGGFSAGAQFYEAIDNLEYEHSATLSSWPNLPAPLLGLNFCTRSFSSTRRWPKWLSGDTNDGETFLFFDGAYLGNGTPYRYNFDGEFVQSYPYDQTAFTVGMIGMTALLAANACLQKVHDEGVEEEDRKTLGMLWLAGYAIGFAEADPELPEPVVLPIRLDTGEVLDAVPAFSSIERLDLSAGFTVLGSGAYASGSGDPTDQALPPSELPAQPSVSCSPTANLHTPASNPGCNSGGRGFTPTYTGPSGTVPVGDDPVGEETLTGKAEVQVWTEIQHTRYLPDWTETTEVLRYGYLDLDDTIRKEGRLVAAGTIEQASSDGQGNMKSTSAQITIFDEPDRPISTRRGDPERKNFNRDELTIFARSAEGRSNDVTPKMLGRLLLNRDSFGSRRTAVLSGVDPLHHETGSFSPDKTMPQFRFPLSHYTNAPADLAGLFIPIIYGEVSDNGSIDPLTGLPNERGKCTPRFAGIYDGWGTFVNNLWAAYRIDGLYGSDCGGLGCYGSGVVTDGKTPSSTLTLTGVGDFSLIPQGGWAQLVLFTARGRTEHRITQVNIAANSVQIDGQIKPGDLQPHPLTGNFPWMIERIDHAPRRVKIDIASRQGVDVMVPGYDGYDRPTPYEDFTCEEGDYRVTEFRIRDVLLLEHLSGGPTITTNTIGTEDQGDGSGLPITDAFLAMAHWWDNCVHRQLSKPPIDGLWPGSIVTLPNYAIASESFGLETLTGGATIVQDAGSGIGNDSQTSAIPLPFTFRFFAADYDELFIYSNGAVSFQSSQDVSLYSQDATFPTTDQAVNIIMGQFGAYELGTSGTIKYEALGSSPTQRFVIEWRDCPNYDDNLKLSTHQIILHEDGRIEFQAASLKAAVDDTYPWTQGVQNADGDTYFGVTDRNNVGQPAFDITNDGQIFSPAEGDASELPSWSDGLTKTMHSSFVDCQEQLAAGGNDLKISAYFDQGISLRDAVQLWNDNLGCWTVVEEHGRVKVFLIDKYADTSTWPRIVETERVYGNVETPRAIDEAMNWVRGGCDWDPDGGIFREDNMRAVSQPAIRRNKGYIKYSKHIDGKLLANPAHFQNVLNRKLGIYADGPIYVSVEGCDFGAVDIPIGTGFVFTSKAGPGEDGYVDHPLIKLDRITDLDGKLVGLLCLDVGTDNLVKPAGRRFIATNDDDLAPLASNDEDVAPLAAA